MSELLRLEAVSKSFSGNRVLDEVSFSLFRGSVLALAGENGAGKSTLMKVITGLYTCEAGQVLYRGDIVSFDNPRHAMDAGIAIIHQELNLLPNLSVTENIFLGRELRNGFGLLRSAEMIAATETLLAKLKQTIDPKALVGSLSLAQQQMVEIAKALSFEAEVIIMDEPTDALSDVETRVLFEVVANLKLQGKGLIFISHRLEEIFELCDQVAILRDGKMVHVGPTREINEQELIRHMVGRELSDRYPYAAVPKGDLRLQAEGLCAPGISDISFDAHAGEVIGFSGLIGAGRTELAHALYGVAELFAGRIMVEGAERRLTSPQDGVAAGIAYVSEDRKGEGLIQIHSLKSNMTLGTVRKFCSALGLLDLAKESRAVEQFVDAFAIKASGHDMPVQQMSGGNQQKVSLAKSLMAEPRILILDEPTRGVDVGAKREIYAQIQSLKEKGLCILLMSSDLPEVLGISDRVLVLSRGRLTASFTREEASQEKIMQAAIA
ncbi:sugar ABC transporter ATP-binding protein [Kiloniella laminariae]|uniref:Sugar ABC transporter ATP-binding protein n=1 Tax=Kiloniella laminariae TaxID=454162 RepID=A0ABT4LHS3_9PROT|nr:sugar ABC transporter ATP-binding protein [Kiloniella laminariae]MCZ4280648.1 sugar ABC transporter ATP-binding protein [Kiloniella laminariae]